MKNLKDIKKQQREQRLVQQNAQVTQIIKEINVQDSQKIINDFELSRLLKLLKKK
jgi:hypothetical protein